MARFQIGWVRSQISGLRFQIRRAGSQFRSTRSQSRGAGSQICGARSQFRATGSADCRGGFRGCRKTHRPKPVGGCCQHFVLEAGVWLYWAAFFSSTLDWPGFRPGGRPPFLLRQERRQRRRSASPVIRCANDCPALLTPGGRRGTRPSGSNSRAGLPRLPLRCSAGRNGLFANTARLLKPWLAFTGKAKPQRLAPTGLSVEARCLLKARSDPPSSGVSGGAFRRGCLRRRSRRVPRRPHDASSAGESSATRTTGEAGSPFFPPFFGDAKKGVARRGEHPANPTLNNGKPMCQVETSLS